jgi:hypothetical protein
LCFAVRALLSAQLDSVTVDIMDVKSSDGSIFLSNVVGRQIQVNIATLLLLLPVATAFCC